MSVNLEDFSPYVSELVPECPGFIIEKAVLDAVIEFCQKSYRLNYECDPIDLDEGESLCQVSATGGNSVVGFFDVRYDGDVLDCLSVKEMAGRYGNKWKTRTGYPVAYLQENTDTIRIYPIPDKDYPESITARVAMSPSRKATRVDNLFIDFYLEAIKHGAAFRLLMQEGKTWYNPALSDRLRNPFYDALYSARNIVMRDVYQRRPLPPVI